MPPKVSKTKKPRKSKSPEKKKEKAKIKYANTDIPAILDLRDELLKKTSDPKLVEEIHKATMGLYPCGKMTSEKDKSACLSVRKDALLKVAAKIK